MTALLSMLPAIACISLVFFLTLISFTLRLGSLEQLDRLCRDRRRPNQFSRILNARQPALLVCDLLLIVLLFMTGWLARQSDSLQTFHWPGTSGLAVFFGWSARVISLLLTGFVVWVAIPRSIARARGGAVMYHMRSTLAVTARLAAPVWNLYVRIERLIHRTTGMEEPDQRPAQRLSAEIMTLVDEGQRQGVIWAGGSRMIHGLLDLHETDVASIMTPRIDLVALNAGTSLHEASEQIMQSGYSRFPVIRETIDDVCGILYTRDLLKCMSDGADVQTQTVDSIVRSAVYVPESQRIDALIDEMQEKKIQLAVVVDEYSGVAGVVTMEDIMEEIVGEITDEFDAEEPQLIHQQDGVIEADARAHIDDLNDEFQLGLPEGADYDTLNGFLLSQFGRIPDTGDSHQWRDIRLTVLDADERQLKRVRVERLEESVELAGQD